MPILLKHLDGNNEQKSRAADLLQAYGDTLIGTPVFHKLIAIVDEKIDFSSIDPEIKASMEKKGSPPDLTSKNVNLIERGTIKAGALMALVMSGSKEGAMRLDKMLVSKSPTERFIADEVKKEHDSAGFWRRGKVPTKIPDEKHLFGHRMLTRKNCARLCRLRCKPKK